jgi:hypothetical protein
MRKILIVLFVFMAFGATAQKREKKSKPQVHEVYYNAGVDQCTHHDDMYIYAVYRMDDDGVVTQENHFVTKAFFDKYKHRKGVIKMEPMKMPNNKK